MQTFWKTSALSWRDQHPPWMEDEKHWEEKLREQEENDFPLADQRTADVLCQHSEQHRQLSALPQCCRITSKCLASPWTNHLTSLWLQTSTAGSFCPHAARWPLSSVSIQAGTLHFMQTHVVSVKKKRTCCMSTLNNHFF